MEKHSSHLKAGMAIGAILGMAAGYFMQSRQGKALSKEARKRAEQLQKQVMKKLKTYEHLSKTKYEEIVDHVIGYYAKTKEIAAKEVPEVRAYLMKKWKDIEAEYREVA